MNKPETAKKPPPDTGLTTAAFLIQIGIEQLTKSPTLRKKVGINLSDLEKASKVRRKLLRELRQ